MSRYLIVIQQNATSRFTAFAPDLPGCAATGKTREEVERRIRAVVEFRIKSMRVAGEHVPPPLSDASHCDVSG